MCNFIYSRASRFTIRGHPSADPSVDSPVDSHSMVCLPLPFLSIPRDLCQIRQHPAPTHAQSFEPPLAACMARIPVDLYRPILEYFASDQSTSRADLFTLLTVSKGLSREVQRLLYNSLTLAADKPQKPTFTDATCLLVRNLKIVVGNRTREAEHIRRCEAILPRLVRLVSLEIRGRAWDMDALERCLPLPGGERGITSLRSLVLDASLTPPVARFIAAQPELEELDLVGGMATAVIPEALDALTVLPDLRKLSTTNTICKHLLPLAPELKHVKLAFDLSETLPDVVSTIESLPLSTESVFFNTTRKDLTPALAALPRTLKNLSTVLVLDQQGALLEHLSALGSLEQLVLNVHQSPPSLINPWSSPMASLSGSNSLSTSPSPSLMDLPSSPSSPKSPLRPLPISLGVESPVVPEQGPPEQRPGAVGGGDNQAREEVDPLVIALKTYRPTLTAIHLDERTYSHRRRSWVSASVPESTGRRSSSNEWKCVQNVSTLEFKTSSRANELELWESLH